MMEQKGKNEKTYLNFGPTLLSPFTDIDKKVGLQILRVYFRHWKKHRPFANVRRNGRKSSVFCAFLKVFALRFFLTKTWLQGKVCQNIVLGPIFSGVGKSSLAWENVSFFLEKWLKFPHETSSTLPISPPFPFKNRQITYAASCKLYSILYS